MRKGCSRATVARVALWLLVLESTQMLGCGCGSTQDRAGTLPSTTEPAAASTEAPVGPDSGIVREDPRRMTPVIENPRLTAVRSAVDAGDKAAAAAAMRSAISDHQPTGEERTRWMYLLGKYLADTKDPMGAAVAFDEAAQDNTWILRDYVLVEAAEAYASLGKYEEALKRVESIRHDIPMADRARLTRAEALDAMGSKEAAVQIWRENLTSDPTGARWQQGALRLASALLEGPADSGRAVDALYWVRRILSESPTSQECKEAEVLERKALSRLSDTERRKYEDWPVEIRLQRGQALADRGRRTEALKLLDELLEDLEEDQLVGQVGCKATGLKARLLGQNRKTRSDSVVAHAEAIRRCKGQGEDLVWVLYRAGRAHSQVGKLSQSLSMYERVEKEFPSHRLADDARLRGARVALLMRNEPKFEAMLSTMGRDYPEGDMVEDGLFELALHHIRKGSWEKAIPPLETSVELREREKLYWESGRARYFLGRAYEATGRSDLGREAHRRVVLDNPLSYYMILAHGRLRARVPEVAAETLKEAETAVPPSNGEPPLPSKLRCDGFERAVELLRLGDVPAARSEILRLGLGEADGDALLLVARLYGRAGDARLAHQVARMRNADWNAYYPQGQWRGTWELAYPQMYLDVVQRETDTSGIPISLAYGIMREESAFDAAAVSWADAYGLMQLIMPTAKGVASSLNMKVDEQALKRPEVNIKLGCKLLSNLRRRFSSAPVLAIPSYNAGAGATQRWLGNRTSDDFDLWVENITYEETRGYTKRVLSSVAVYAYLYHPSDLPLALQLPDQLDL